MVRTSAALLLVSWSAAAAQEPLRPGELNPFPRAGDSAPAEPEAAPARPLDREESAAERARRERGVFDSSGRIMDQREQTARRPGAVTDSLRRGQSPSYSVGPGLVIERRP